MNRCVHGQIGPHVAFDGDETEGELYTNCPGGESLLGTRFLRVVKRYLAILVEAEQKKWRQAKEDVSG